MKPIGVLILSYNHPFLTQKCVESVLLKAPQNTPIYLVHNGSLPQHRQFLLHQFPQIEHIVIENNLGFSGGMNYGFKEVYKNCIWVLAITNDCELLQWGALPSIKNPALLAPLVYKKNQMAVDSVGAVVHLKTGQLQHLKSLAEYVQLKDKSFFYVPGTAFLLHQNIFKTTQGFDESLHTYWEDVDLCLRMSSLNLLLSIQWDFQFAHKGGKTCYKDRFYTNYLFHRNKWIVCRRWSQNYLFQDKVLREIYFLKDFLLRLTYLLRFRRWQMIWQFIKAYVGL